MIATLTIIGVAFYWMLRETDWLRIRLESTEYQRQQLAIKAKREFGNMPMGKVKDMPEDTETVSLYQPSQFTPLDLPATTGDLNIICEKR